MDAVSIYFQVGDHQTGKQYRKRLFRKGSQVYTKGIGSIKDDRGLHNNSVRKR
jgi:hypothetical protein